MTFFRHLPEVEKCCYCISLRNGTIIIAVLHFIVVLEAIFGAGSNEWLNKCYSEDKSYIRIIGYVSVIVAILILVGAILCLVGVIKKQPYYIEIFMYINLVLIIFNLIVSLILFFAKQSKEECKVSYALGGATLIGILFLCYFLIVMNSYRRFLLTI